MGDPLARSSMHRDTLSIPKVIYEKSPTRLVYLMRTGNREGGGFTRP